MLNASLWDHVVGLMMQSGDAGSRSPLPLGFDELRNATEAPEAGAVAHRRVWS